MSDLYCLAACRFDHLRAEHPRAPDAERPRPVDDDFVADANVFVGVDDARGEDAPVRNELVDLDALGRNR